MRVFIYEYTCAVAPPAGLSELRREGWAMLRAVLEDFGRIPGVQTVTLLDRSVPRPQGCEVVPTDIDAEKPSFRRLVRSAAYTLVIAPECDGLLENRCRWVVQAGGRLLCSRPDAVALAGDKLALGAHLCSCGVPTPQCWLEAPTLDWDRLPYPVVRKPRHGAGSQATYLFRCPAERAALTRSEGPWGRSILQPFISGQPASVAFLMGPLDTLALLPASQELSADGRFHYRGGTIPLPASLAERARTLARRAVACVPGLGGYVGVDLVLGAENDGSSDHVIEINPRLTTSYVGLRRMTENNLAEVWLHLLQGEAAVEPNWRSGTVRFTTDGSVTELR